MQSNGSSMDFAPHPFVRSLLMERTHSEPLRVSLEQEPSRSPACTEPDTTVMPDSQANAAGDLSKVRSQPNLPALLAPEASLGLNRAHSQSRTRKRSWAGLRPAELKSSSRLPRRWHPSPGGSSAQGCLPTGELWNAASNSRENWTSNLSEASIAPPGWASKSSPLQASRMASGPMQEDPMDTELTPSQKIIAELLAQHAAARAQGRPIVTPGRHSKVSSPAGGASNRSSLTGAPELCSPFSLHGAKQRAMSSGSEHLPHPRPHASLSVTGRSISRSQLLPGASRQLSPASSLSQPMSATPTQSSLDMTHHSFASPFSSGSITNRESSTGHSQPDGDLTKGSSPAARKAVHDGPARDFSSLGLTLRDGPEGLRPGPIGQSSFSTLAVPQWPLLSSAAQPTEPAFASLLAPLVPPDLPFDVLDWDPLPDGLLTESPTCMGGLMASSASIPAWHGLRGSVGSELSEVGQFHDKTEKDQPPQAQHHPEVCKEAADVQMEPQLPTNASFKTAGLPDVSTAISSHSQSSQPALGNEVHGDTFMSGFDEAQVLEDLYLHTPGFTSMLEELASNTSMKQDG